MREPITASSKGRHCQFGMVVVEGIMGSGKSSTMRMVSQILQAAGHQILPIHERFDPHPVRATDELEHWFEPWRDTTSADLAQRALKRWALFVGEIQSNSQIPVLDGQLFHGDLTHMMLMEAGEDAIADYIRTLEAVIRALNPLVIYLWQESVEDAIGVVCRERGPDWADYQVNWKLASPYAIRRELRGVAGLTALYQDYRRLTDGLFAGLTLSKLSIETSGRDWAAYERVIGRALFA